mmetsp:Transcript_11966/g.24921  ORF Transcript_11966/g.24921 Transcript_11966/m.24921 type:complete len:255 (+) Transcript_11966:405-1169(+)
MPRDYDFLDLVDVLGGNVGLEVGQTLKIAHIRSVVLLLSCLGLLGPPALGLLDEALALLGLADGVSHGDSRGEELQFSLVRLTLLPLLALLALAVAALALLLLIHVPSYIRHLGSDLDIANTQFGGGRLDPDAHGPLNVAPAPARVLGRTAAYRLALPLLLLLFQHPFHFALALALVVQTANAGEALLLRITFLPNLLAEKAFASLLFGVDVVLPGLARVLGDIFLGLGEQRGRGGGGMGPPPSATTGGEEEEE